MDLNNNCSTSFTGTTKIYAISDSHQETRKTSAFLSKILDESRRNNNVLFLNCGDIFKGIYPKTMERDCYLKLKEANPDIEMVMTLGNNDFGFNKDGLDYLIDTVKTFSDKGIKTVCANIFDKDGNRPEWLEPYTIIERDGDRTFVTGFCIDNINTAKFGIVPKKQEEVLDEICSAIKQEKPDNVIILNHDYMPVSKNLVKSCKDKGVDVDIIIGGHDHEFVQPDKKLNIYYPQSFSDSMYQMNIVNKKGKKSVDGVKMVKSDGLDIKPEFETEISSYEEETGLLDSIAPSTLNLEKRYSKPCSLGSFLADEMKKTADADIGFFSTGFLMKPMLYKTDSEITNYDFKKTIIAETPIKKVELSVSDLKEVFQHSLKNNGYGSSNPKFLQCSNNVRLQGKDNPAGKTWELKQIFINDKPLLDSKGEPFEPDKKYTCVIDSYIADGGQGFSVLQQREKQDVVIDGTSVKINEVLMNGLKSAPEKYEKGADYPSFKIDEL
ncbi:MAG: 5'-nucleotidase C-terminal domain-containing protein [Cyanobacteria bacterium RUI128]|nr:5'-nucleotidase C-terminal domain-containing protein [Cyanobacteria bacterium RUI128]